MAITSNAAAGSRVPVLPTTAAIHPERFPEVLTFARNKLVLAVILVLLLVAGFALRVNQLGAESFGEDELNKLQTVAEYRENGLSGRNGEHPFLMKGLQTLSISTVERINAALAPNWQISLEAALRFPIAFFGSLTVLILFLLVSEIFGRSIGLVSAALWAVEPVAIGFDRIAKEDSLVLFFFLLTNLLWIKGQSAAERGESRWFRWMLFSAAAFAGLMASKYYPHLLGVQAAYYIIFQEIPGRRWILGKMKWLAILAVMGLTFLVFNPTIVLPDTWREMLKFSSENRIGHDSYEFMGSLYRNQMTAWLNGVPWSFYYVFIAVKTSLTTLILALIGIPLLFRRKMGDGRFFILFWAFFWFMPFTFLGGKFTRYFTIVEPLLLISAAVAVCWIVNLLSSRIRSGAGALYDVIIVAVIAVPLINSIQVAPNYRMFTNVIGGGRDAARSYFPHDEFYDNTSRETVARIASAVSPGITVACETPGLFDHYAELLGREDLKFVSLSDADRVAQLIPGDVIVLTEGRRYFSNSRYWELLGARQPHIIIEAAEQRANRVFILDETTLHAMKQRSATRS